MLRYKTQVRRTLIGTPTRVHGNWRRRGRQPTTLTKALSVSDCSVDLATLAKRFTVKQWVLVNDKQRKPKKWLSEPVTSKDVLYIGPAISFGEGERSKLDTSLWEDQTSPESEDVCT